MPTDLAFTGDPHLAIDVQVPAGRHQETFFDEQRAKLSFIADYARVQELDALVSPGDILNYKNPSLYTAKSINSLLVELNMLNDAVPFFSISGNHDLKMSSRQMKPTSVYNIFTQASVIKDLHGQTFQISKNVTLSGIDFNPSPTDLMGEIQTLNDKLDPKMVNILVIHEHLLPDGEELPFCHHLNYSEFLQFTNINVIHSGHLHKGYPTQTVSIVDIDDEDDTAGHEITFINPWSLCRLSRDNYAMSDEHKPEIIHLTVSDEGEVSFKHIEVPHKSFDKAFVMSELNSVESRNLDIGDFVDSLQGFQKSEEFEIPEGTDMKQIVRDKIDYYMELSER